MTHRYHAIGWLARSRDPFRSEDDAPASSALGPTLTLLTHRDSEVVGRVDRFTMLHQSDRVSRERAQALTSALHERAPHLLVQAVEVSLENPTDHEAIRSAVLPHLRALTANPSNHTPLVHLSPGTPAMHAVWLLLCTTEASFVRAGGVMFESVDTPKLGTRQVTLDLPGSYRLYQRFVATGTSVERPGIADPDALRTPALRAVYAQASALARLRMPVLLLGERGTGKSTLAAWLRHHAPRRERPSNDEVWQVACGEFSPELLASELFGHTQGAFTGAVRARGGLLQAIGDGTLFLDEVVDLDRQLQRQLLKVVEEGAFRAVGADTIQRTDARLLFATNHPEATLDARLDADFLDRIGYLRLTVPALRDCVADHPTLWRDVAARAGERGGVNLVSALAPEQERALLDGFATRPLDGNLRDFYLVAYHLCAAIDGDRVPASAIRAALAELDRRQAQADAKGEPFDDVVRAWLERRPLGALMRHHERVDVRAGIGALQAWIAREATAAARTLSADAAEWTGVAERTLRSWSGPTRGKKSH
jgi:DNA-binding NtrC family response regulator